MSISLKNLLDDKLPDALLSILHGYLTTMYTSGSYSIYDLLMLATVEEILSSRGTCIESPIVPTPYGSITPSLEDCNYVNEWLVADSYLDIVTCPSCGSGAVVILSRRYNPWLLSEHSTLVFDRFFCISCQDSWCYERER